MLRIAEELRAAALDAALSPEARPMRETVDIGRERIVRLLNYLRCEIERGMLLEGEIDETLGLRFYVPMSKSIPDGVVFCEFHTRPSPRWGLDPCGPRLKLVTGGRP